MNYKKFEEYQVMMDQARPDQIGLADKLIQKLVEIDANDVCYRAVCIQFAVELGESFYPLYVTAFLKLYTLFSQVKECWDNQDYSQLDVDVADILLANVLVMGESIRSGELEDIDVDKYENTLKSLLPYYDGSVEFTQVDGSWS